MRFTTKEKKKMINFIFGASNEGVYLYDLPIISLGKQKVNDVMVEQKNILSYLENASDFGLSQVKIKITQFARNVEMMMSNEGFLQIPELFQDFVDMKSRAIKLELKMSVEDWNEFSALLVKKDLQEKEE